MSVGLSKSRGFVALIVVLGGCRPDLAVGPVLVTCGSSNECPANYACFVERGVCVSASTNCVQIRGSEAIPEPDGNVCNLGESDMTGLCLGGVCSESVCSDGYVDTERGETCDAGPNNADTAAAPCRTDCSLPRCGDGVVNDLEECDDGNAVDSDDCLSVCVFARCGDAVVRAGVEECDDGNSQNQDGCLNSCLNNTCGDGVRNLEAESCDDGNLSNTDACLNDCTINTCGDGFADSASEACDDGNDSNEDGCLNDCTSNVCGDGILNIEGESCDDANTMDGDYCSSACDAVTGFCGDSMRQANEVCDNTESADCATLEPFYDPGTVGCAASCDAWLTTGCVNHQVVPAQVALTQPCHDFAPKSPTQALFVPVELSDMGMPGLRGIESVSVDVFRVGACSDPLTGTPIAQVDAAILDQYLSIQMPVLEPGFSYGYVVNTNPQPGYVGSAVQGWFDYTIEHHFQDVAGTRIDLGLNDVGYVDFQGWRFARPVVLGGVFEVLNYDDTIAGAAIGAPASLEKVLTSDSNNQTYALFDTGGINDYQFEVTVGKAAIDNDAIEIWFMTDADGTAGVDAGDGYALRLSAGGIAPLGEGVRLARYQAGVPTVIISNLTDAALDAWNASEGFTQANGIAEYRRVRITVAGATTDVKLSGRNDTNLEAATSVSFSYTDTGIRPVGNIAVRGISQPFWIDSFVFEGIPAP